MPLDFGLSPVGPGRWTAVASPDWLNPERGVWGGYAIGLCIRIVEAERDAFGEPLSLTLTYAAPLPGGRLDVTTRRLRQGRSVGIWSVEMRPAGSTEICVHGMISTAQRPSSRPFVLARMPETPPPEALPVQARRGCKAQRDAFEWRSLESDPPSLGDAARTLAWVRARDGGMDKALLGILTDASPPRVMHGLGTAVLNTTLSLTVYFLASSEQLAAIEGDSILVDYDGGVGNAGASNERSSYWSRSGELLATSDQLVWYRDPAAP